VEPLGRALWFVERHFKRDVRLEEIAANAGVSRFHMTRAFGAATGLSLMRYLRGRRLTEAARALAGGAPDILAVALDAGYNSHEAFTRAFRDQFGVTPEGLREQGSLGHISLLEPIRMEQNLIPIEPPRIEKGAVLLIAGLGERYTQESSAGIPAQWQRFLASFHTFPGKKGSTAYGVCCNTDDEGNFDYICGVEVSSFSRVPPDWSRIRIPEQTYAVFHHRDHVSTIRSTWNTIWKKWLPASGRTPADGPCFERYGNEFDEHTGLGGLEIWLPIQP